jgi:hypothetical protein
MNLKSLLLTMGSKAARRVAIALIFSDVLIVILSYWFEIFSHPVNGIPILSFLGCAILALGSAQRPP